MKTPENERSPARGLGLAQLEIKSALREQLLKAIPAAQRTRKSRKTRMARIREAGHYPMPPSERTRNRDGATLRRPRVLYVEDSEPNFRLIESILK